MYCDYTVVWTNDNVYEFDGIQTMPFSAANEPWISEKENKEDVFYEKIKKIS